MLNHSFWPARALPAGLPTPRCPGCATFAQQCLFTARQGHGLLPITINIILRLTIRSPCHLLGVIVAAAMQPAQGEEVGGNMLNQALSLRATAATYWLKCWSNCLLSSLKALAKRASNLFFASVVVLK